MSRYLYLIERSSTGFAAFVPDLDGCVATGATRDEVEENIRGAIELHLEGMREDGIRVPAPSTTAGYAEVPKA
jgi:predicted RNase H-like HicB family nuclease